MISAAQASCSYNFIDYYGRISESWANAPGDQQQLKTHLDPQVKDLHQGRVCGFLLSSPAVHPEVILDPQNTGELVVGGKFLNQARAEHAAKKKGLRGSKN